MKFYKPKKDFNGEIKAVHKGVIANIVINRKEKWVSIYIIESFKPDKGNAQDFVKTLKRKIPKGFVLWSSPPLNDKWKHICDKLKVKYSYD